MIPADMLDRPLACACGRTHHIPTRHIAVGRGALDSLPEALAATGGPARLLAISDAATRAATWEKISPRLRSLGVSVTEVLLPPGPHGPPFADQANHQRIQEAVRPDTNAILAIGSGTINDLAKLSSRTCGVPYFVCATAPSMNGYPSANASLLEGGLKVTRPAQAPTAILADLEVLTAAPLAMIRAGLGDLLSQQTALADWRLSTLVEETYYCPAVARLVAEPIRQAGEDAGALNRREEAAVARLTEALILSGFTMVMAGQSSPASGAEHLISHYWEMEAGTRGRPEPLHGAQVGVTCILMAELMRWLADTPSRNLPGSSAALPDAWEEAEPALAARHGALWNVVRDEARAKYRGASSRNTRFASLQERWDEIWAVLGPLCPEPRFLREALRRAGAPTTPDELGLSGDEVHRALLGSREIRSRYTVLDLAAEVGLLEGWAAEIADCLAPIDPCKTNGTGSGRLPPHPSLSPEGGED